MNTSSVTHLLRIGFMRNPGQRCQAAWRSLTTGASAAMWSGVVTQLAKIYKDSLKPAGIDASAVFVPPNSTDIVAPLIAAKAGEKDAIETLANTGSQCIATAEALEQLKLTDKLTVGYSTCFNQALKDQYPGGVMPNWSTGDINKNLYIKDNTGQMGAMIVAQRAHSKDKWLDVLAAYNAPAYFGSVMFIAKMMNAAGGDVPTYDGVVKAIQGYGGPLWVGPDKVKFGEVGATSVGSFAQIFSRQIGGKWKYLSPFIK